MFKILGSANLLFEIKPKKSSPKFPFEGGSGHDDVIFCAEGGLSHDDGGG